MILHQSLVYSQPTKSKKYNVDSLAQTINGANGEYKKTALLEDALKYLAKNNQSEKPLVNLITSSELSTKDFLKLNAYNARKHAHNGNWDDLIKFKNSQNPYVQFYLGNSAFLDHDLRNSSSLYRTAIKQFISLDDTLYILSTYNNLGTVMWHSDIKDSALFYYKKVKEFTNQYNAMLEANILAIANVMKDSTLAAAQIRIIKQYNPTIDNDIFYTNAYNHYEQFNASSLDSMRLFLCSKYSPKEIIPESLLMTFIAIDHNREQIAFSLDSAANGPYFQDAIEALVYSDIITDSVFTPQRINSLKVASNNNTSLLLDLYSSLPIADRRKLQSLLNSQKTTETDNEEAESIKALYYSTKQDYHSYKKSAERVAIILAFLILVSFVFIQHKALKASRHAKYLSEQNKNLLAAQLQNVTKANETHKKIQEALNEQIKLRKALQTLSKSSSETDADLLSDLNSINTYKHGINRFKIKKICREFHAPQFAEIESFLNEQEMEVLKLTILEFKSKDIAFLMDTSPRYINNIRVRIKKILNEKNISFKQIIDDLSANPKEI